MYRWGHHCYLVERVLHVCSWSLDLYKTRAAGKWENDSLEVPLQLITGCVLGCFRKETGRGPSILALLNHLGRAEREDIGLWEEGRRGREGGRKRERRKERDMRRMD